MHRSHGPWPKGACAKNGQKVFRIFVFFYGDVEGIGLDRIGLGHQKFFSNFVFFYGEVEGVGLGHQNFLPRGAACLKTVLFVLQAISEQQKYFHNVY